MDVHEIEIIKRHINAMFVDLIRANEVATEEALPTSENIAVETQRVVASEDELDAIAESEWKLVGTRKGETYSWPEGADEYSTFEVYESENPTLGQYAIGKVERSEREDWGRRRPYLVVFRLGAGRGSKQPIGVFVATDDYADTQQYVAVIRGAGGPRGQRMFSPDETAPAPYRSLRVVTFRDHIAGTPQFSGYNKLAVLAHEDDVNTMIRHAALQVALRH